MQHSSSRDGAAATPAGLARYSGFWLVKVVLRVMMIDGYVVAEEVVGGCKFSRKEGCRNGMFDCESE